MILALRMFKALRPDRLGIHPRRHIFAFLFHGFCASLPLCHLASEVRWASMIQISPSYPLQAGYSREAFLDDLLEEEGLIPRLLALVAVMTAGAALYGAVLGAWRGGPQMIYAAIKLPLVLIVTSGLTMPFNWMTAILLGLRIRFGQVAVLTFLVLAVASVVLASLVPVVWLFTVSAPPVSVEARTTHNLLYLLHTGVVAFSGVVGASILRGTLGRLTDETHTANRIFFIWLVTFALVGGEVAWALRPFVGSIYFPVVFLRDDALSGNVYEFILRDILPHISSELNPGGS